MRAARTYVGVIIALALMALLVVLLLLKTGGGSNPSTKITQSNGAVVAVTPVSQMRVRTAEDAPVIEASSYRLKVTGLVKNPITLSLDDLKSMGSEERYVKLPCVEGWTEAGLWKGTPLLAVLDKAGLKDNAKTVVFSSPGGYTTSLRLEDIRAVDPMLAYGVNHVDLPQDQGFPVRLVVPKRLGYKWIKWVTAIKVIEGDFQGYWESRGYDNKADASNR